MRVLYYHQHFSTPAGAAGGRSYEFARRLVDRGHSVTVVCGSYGVGRTGLEGAFSGGRRRGVTDGIDIIELELPYSNRMGFFRRTSIFIWFALKSLRIALRERYDLIFVTSTPLTVAIPGIIATKMRRIPLVFEVRDLWPELPREMGVITNPVLCWAMACIARTAYRSARGCVGLAPGIVETIIHQGGDARHTVLIPNGCDLDMFCTASNGDSRVGYFTAFYAGTFGIANGLDAVLDVAVVLKKRGRNDIKLVLVGDGATKDGLVDRARAEGLDNCEFRSPVSRTELAMELPKASVGLQVLSDVPGFYFGTSPNKFFDYIASGIPVVTNTKGWVANMVTASECGIVAPPGDRFAFADALEYLADNSAHRAKMGRNARRLAESQFDRRQLGDEFVDLLEKVMRN